MYCLFITLTNIDYKEDVLLSLQSAGITRATSIDAVNLRKALSDEFSLFTGFFKSAGEREDEQILIITYIDDLAQAREFVENLKMSGVDLQKTDILRMVAVPAVLSFDWETGLTET